MSKAFVRKQKPVLNRPPEGRARDAKIMLALFRLSLIDMRTAKGRRRTPRHVGRAIAILQELKARSPAGQA